MRVLPALYLQFRRIYRPTFNHRKRNTNDFWRLHWQVLQASHQVVRERFAGFGVHSTLFGHTFWRNLERGEARYCHYCTHTPNWQDTMNEKSTKGRVFNKTPLNYCKSHPWNKSLGAFFTFSLHTGNSFDIFWHGDKFGHDAVSLLLCYRLTTYRVWLAWTPIYHVIFKNKGL